MTRRPSRTTSVTTATVHAVMCEKSIQALLLSESIRAGRSTMSRMRIALLVADAAQRARVVYVAHRRGHFGQRADRLHELRHRQEAVRRRAEDDVRTAQPALEVARRALAAGVLREDLRSFARMRLEKLGRVEQIAVERADELRMVARPLLVHVDAVERVLAEDVEAAQHDVSAALHFLILERRSAEVRGELADQQRLHPRGMIDADDAVVERVRVSELFSRAFAQRERLQRVERR